MTPYFTEKMRKYFLSGCRMAYFYLPKKSLHLFPLGRGKFQPCFKNILLFAKISSLIPTERSQMHTLNLKKFYPFTYLELGSRNAPCFHKKFEKYFLFGCGTAYFTYLKSPFTYLEFECQNATCFSEKAEKIF